MLRRIVFCSKFIALAILFSNSAFANELTFDRHTLSEEFHSEGAVFADINNDGNLDLISGPFWYQGPDFKKQIRYFDGESLSIKGYSKHFFTWTFDFNKDGHIDILTVGMPGEPAFWFENPGRETANSSVNKGANPTWKKHMAIDNICNESPDFTDITGDGNPELICIRHGAYGYIEPQYKNEKVSFRFTAITPNKGLGRFTHGMGVGDVDGDGRRDLLETNGWWRQTKTKGELFQYRPFRFAQSGGAQMFAYDFDGDGDNDVISSQNAHGYGLTWFEQKRSGTKIDFIPHKIMTDKPADNAFGLAVSQMHGLALADVDNDGICDIVTGKRYWAHGGADPGSKQLPILFWLKTIRKKGRVIFEPRLIDERSGVGTQVTTGDVNGDKRVDVLIGNKLGTYLFVQKDASTNGKEAAGNPSKKDWANIPLNAGTSQFNENVRTGQPLTPEEQAKTFVLPPGFEIQLVAAEPQIAKPMNMAFDSTGRLWVSSSVEYPFAATDATKAQDAIKILEDTNDDGRADRVTTFADKLNIPMGLLPYKNGVICFSIPNIWFLEDTNADGKADKRTILYGPFDTSRDTHGMCSSFTDGKDGWIYACHGFNNQSRVSGADGHEIEMNSGNVFRFKPDGSRIEVVTRGQVNPFGLTIDSYGDIFSADCHTKPINLILPGGHHDSFGKPHDGLGYIPNVMEHLHDSTGIGGISLGEYTNFPAVYQTSTFGGNVVTGRINRNQLLYSGSSMTAREESDFLIPGDPWFRPVNLQVAADGSLYVADFYNAIIGHYEVDLNHPKRDRKRGRIWRVVYTGDKNRRDNQTPRTGSTPARSDAKIANRLRKFANQSSLDSNAKKALLTGLGKNSSPIARRFAVMAIAKHPKTDFSNSLIELLGKTPASDRYLIHAIKIALREQLQEEDTRFKQIVGRIPDGAIQHFGDVCLAIKSESAANFIVKNISQLSKNDLTKSTAYLEFVSQYGAANSLDPIVSVARKQFENDINFQLKLLESIRAGLTRRGEPLTPNVRNWATSVAKKLFGPSPTTRTETSARKAIAWNYFRTGDAIAPSNNQNVFVQSNVRKSSDGMAKTPLWSSIVKGEQQTGVYRSEPFELNESFKFYLAGHDGFPDKPLGKLNYAQLRLSATDQVIAKSPPPRNDTAHPISWNTKQYSGQLAIFEIVDGDTAGAYAWLAAGRFSVAGLNPSKQLQNQQQAAQIVAKFELTELRERVLQLLNGSVGGQLAESLSLTLISLDAAKLDSPSVFRAIAGTQQWTNISPATKKSAINMIVSSDSSQAKKVLSEIAKSASATQQRQLAEALAGDKAGAMVLMDLVRESVVSPEIFGDNRVVNMVLAHDIAGTPNEIAEIKANLPATNSAILTQIKLRLEGYATKAPVIAKGAEIFDKNCAACHQIGGKGKQVGPNLDGIGSRGLERLTEDILQPNRNVDAAFRASLIATVDGRALNGFVKKTDDQTETHLTLVDTTGKEILIAKDDVENQKETRSSPMPNNFVETIGVDDFRDLIGFLMKSRK